MSTKHISVAKPLVDGIFTVLNNFVFKEVDEITLTGTSGTATVLNNGVSRTATFATSLTQTATNFVAANAAAYLAAGSVLTNVDPTTELASAKLYFRANVPGVGFTGSTTITNNTLTLSGTVAANDVTYPIYKTIPKPAGDAYIYIGGVIDNEQGTSDTFIYTGSVLVKVVVDNQITPEDSLAQDIRNVIRGLLKPTPASVFSITPHTLVAFNLESGNGMDEQSERNSKVSLIDIYNFIIS